MYNMTRRECLRTLSVMADAVIFDCKLMQSVRDEDDVRWAEYDAELVCAQAMEYAQIHYPTVINNEADHG